MIVIIIYTLRTIRSSTKCVSKGTRIVFDVKKEKFIYFVVHVK